MNDEPTTNLIRPGRIPELIPNEPVIAPYPVDRRKVWADWAEGRDVFPARVQLGGVPTPRRVTEFPRPGPHEGPSWYTQGIEFVGLGAVVVTGLYGRKCDPCRVSAAVTADYGALLDAASLDGGYPDVLCWMPHPTISKFLTRRLHGMLLGLGALAYRLRPDWWGGESPVVQAWCDEWVWASQLPRRFDPLGLDLTQLDTY